MNFYDRNKFKIYLILNFIIKMLNILKFDSQNNLMNIVEKVNKYKFYLKEAFPDGLVPFFEIQYFIENESENDPYFFQYSHIIEAHLLNYIDNSYDNNLNFNLNSLLFYQNNLNNNNTINFGCPSVSYFMSLFNFCKSFNI